MTHQCSRYLVVQAKTSDCCNVQYDSENCEDLQHDGYVPSGLGIGGGDYIDFNVCVECGKIKDWKPLSDEAIAEAIGEEG